MYNCMQGFFKKYILAGFLLYQITVFFFFPKILKILETTFRVGSTPHPYSCFFLPGPKAPQRDKEHSLDCQRSASTAKLPSHIISQL